MGLFGKRDKETPAEPLTEADGFCGIAVAAVYSDGVLNADEDDRVVEALLALMPGAGERDVRDGLVRMARLAQKQGDARLLRHAVDAIPPARREDAFRLAAEIIIADGDVESEEGTFLDRFRVALGLDHDQAQRVIASL